MPDTKWMVALLQELINARGPCGEENEVRKVCRREMDKFCDEVWEDPAGNGIGCIRGKSKKVSAIRVMAHMDEIGMMVKRVESDGSLSVRSLGSMRPGYMGQGPVDIMADSGILPGILSIGPVHTTAETSNVAATKEKPIEWEHVRIFTGRSDDKIRRAGVHPGTRVVIARERRKLFEVGDFVGGYFMDDRAAAAVTIGCGAILKKAGKRPAGDVYLAMTTAEEMGAVGAVFASRRLPGDLALAVDVGPVAKEYGTELTAEPIIAYRDGRGLYTKSVADRLVALSRELGQKPQCAALESYGSDGSISKTQGHAARAGLIAIPTDNTHGFEIIHREGLLACAKLLAAYLEKPT